MSLTIILPLLLAAISLVLPGIFKADHWPDYINGIIAVVVVALFSFLTAWADNSLISGNFAANWAITAGIYSGLLAGPAAPLDQWLQSHAVLPFLKPAPANSNPLTSLGTSAFVPADSTTPTIIPPRSSAPPTPPTSA